jgi:hypothetical protein
MSNATKYYADWELNHISFRRPTAPVLEQLSQQITGSPALRCV